MKALIHNNVKLEFNFLFKKLLLDNYISFSYPDITQWKAKSVFLSKIVWKVLQCVSEKSATMLNVTFGAFFNVDDDFEVSNNDSIDVDEMVKRNLENWKLYFMQFIEKAPPSTIVVKSSSFFVDILVSVSFC